MPAINVLRILVGIEVLLFAASVLTGIFPSEATLAADEYRKGAGASPLWRLLESDSVAINYTLATLLVAFLATYSASLVGLVLLKSWARRVYVAVFVVGVCSQPLYGYTFIDPLSGSINYLGAVCSGAILATVFLSGVKVAFERRPPNNSFERTREG